MTEPAPSPTPLLEVTDLCKYFPIRSTGLFARQVATVKAVDHVSFTLMPGRTLGLVGESGCGKTTAARTILRALDPTGGSVRFDTGEGVVDLCTLHPRELKPLRTRMQMIFQDPFSSLNPRMTIERVVGEPLLVHRIGSIAERRERIVAILERVGLSGDHLKRYPHEFSGGQRQRIGIARALILHPRLVVADEAVSALDVSVQAQVINLLAELQEEFDLTYIFVAHDLSVVRHIADEVAVMYAGRLVEHAPTEQLFAAPRHPYTRALLSAVPDPDPDKPMNLDLTGEVADPANPPPGCPFHPRCDSRFGPCDGSMPPAACMGPGHHVACHAHPVDTDMTRAAVET
ncbi:MAG: ABC transporter ATP-binding protein [Planctomycetota bacterium]